MNQTTQENVIFDGEDEQPEQKPEEERETSKVKARYKISPLTLTVFQNQNGYYQTQLQRTYTRDDGDTFEYTESLRPQDLRKAARLMEKAADDLQGLKVQNVE